MADINLIVSTNADEAKRDINNLGNSVLAQVNKVVALERGYKKLDVAFNKGKIDAQKYALGIRQVDAAIKQARTGQDQLTSSTLRTASAMKTSAGAMKMMGTATAVTTRRMGRGSVITQQAGYQVGDFLVQIQSGTNAMVAFGQQATQIAGTLTILGGKWVLIGSALGILIPLVTALGAAFMRTGTDASFLGDSLDGISPVLDALAKAASWAKEAFLDMANVIVNNLDRMLVYSLSFATFLAGKFVLGLIAAKVATMGLVGSLLLLKAAIIRTGIGALVVGAGELIYQFVRLVKATGGVGEAFGLLKEVGVEAFNNIAAATKTIPSAMRLAALNMNIWFTTQLGSMMYKFTEFTWDVADGLNNLFGTSLSGMKGDPITGLLPSQEFTQAVMEMEGKAEELQDIIENGLAGTSTDALQRLKDLLSSFGSDIDVRDWDLFGDKKDDDEAGAREAAIKATQELIDLEKEREALAGSIGQSIADGFTAMVDGTMSVKDAFRSMARDIIKQLWDIFVVKQIVNAVSGAFGFADGGAFSGGSVIPFANGGVVNGPTNFGMSGGRTGLMGEAGPEAIMPLKRGPGGKLGVEASGGGQSVVVNQSFNFSANGDDTVKKLIAQAAPKIAQMTKSSLLDDRRRGGATKAAFG